MQITIEEQTPGKLWKVTATAAAYTVTRTVSVTPTRVNVSDTVESSHGPLVESFVPIPCIFCMENH